MQPWHRWREPLAIMLLVVLALLLVLRGVAVGLAYDAGGIGGYVGAIPGDDLLLLAAAAAVLWCTTPVRGGGSADRAPSASPHAWPIAVAGLVVVGLAVLGWFVLAVANVVTMVSWPTPDIGFVLLVIEGLLRLAVPVAALAAVVLAVRRTASAPAPAGAVSALTTSAGGSDEDVPAVTAAPERLPAAWQADEATGAVWLTADDAAQGQPGLSWSDPAATAGAVTSVPWAPPPPAAEEPTAPPPPPVAPASEDDDLR